MSNSEWFYIKRWRSNQKKTWCVIDHQDNLLLDDVNKYTAMCKQAELRLQDIETNVVNKAETAYTDLNSERRGIKNENSNTK